jgi:hypothetical protein
MLLQNSGMVGQDQGKDKGKGKSKGKGKGKGKEKQKQKQKQKQKTLDPMPEPVVGSKSTAAETLSANLAVVAQACQISLNQKVLQWNAKVHGPFCSLKEGIVVLN